ncbi:hypothetical protein [Spiroplasma endosymbiont of Danaus chrysippus]|uniref:hypothetical protein n=1 Tax=Spiroplasma endosymbiont of Danaus chrysippus TaxID=2691041 RepID=UPI00157A54C7|nr:hypothetical protein [Spiroplasma endosymbiont of Danaus chrysippus]
MLTHNVGTNVKHYQERNGVMVYGTTTIWVNTHTSEWYFELYFSKKPKHEDDIKWDGNYPDWYFDGNV